MSTLRKLEPPPQQLPPSAPEVEQHLLGALLQFPQAWLTAAEIVREEMFYVLANRDIYAAGLHLFRNGAPVNTLTVCQRLREEGKLDSVGGSFYLSQIANAVSGSANVEWGCRILAQYFVLRRLIMIGDEAVKGGYDQQDPFDLLDRTSAAITDLYAVTQPTVISTAADEICTLLDKQPSKSYTFGIPELDRYASLEAGVPAVFAGRPGIGKSIFCTAVCWHLTLAGPVLLFSPEMTRKQVTSRILAMESGVPYRPILKGVMDEQQLHTVSTTAMRIADRMSLLKIDPQAGITPEQVRMRTERAMKSHEVIAFAIDHLHKMRTGDARMDRDEYQRISACMDGVTDVAKNTMLPALIMAQLNREVERRSDKRPTMADLRGSGKIEENAAVVGLLYREGYYMAEPPWEDTLEINLGKNRDGEVRLTTCGVTPALSRIGSVSQANIKGDATPF